MSDLSEIFKKVKITNVVSGTNKTLKTLKKAIPVYKEIRPYIRKEKKLFNSNDDINNIKTDIKEKEYNDNLTFFQ